MKKLKRLFKLVLFSILAQIIFLAYVNYIYLPSRNIIRASMYEFEDATIENKSIKISEDAKSIRVSFNGLFAAYLHENNVVITDIKKNVTVKTIYATGGEFEYFKWLPDRNILIYSIKSVYSDFANVEVKTYDISADYERSYPKINKLSKSSIVRNIELSPLTNVVYVLIKTGKSGAQIYKYDIMDNIHFVLNVAESTTMKEISLSDFLVYQSEKGTIKIRNGTNGSESEINIATKQVLLSTDENDKIYIGEFNKENLVFKIRYGSYEQKVENWKEIILSNPKSYNDIFITPKGKILVADSYIDWLMKLENSEKISFEGDLVEVLNEYIISFDNGMLNLYTIN